MPRSPHPPLTLFFLMMRPPPISTLFPSPTLFRSPRAFLRATRINHDFAHPDDPVCGHAKVPTPSPDTKLAQSGLMRHHTPQLNSPQPVLPSLLPSRHSHQPRLCAP